jgi:hypothetical protein
MVYIWLVLSKLDCGAAYLEAEQDVFKAGFCPREIVATLVDEIYGLSVLFSIDPAGYSDLHSSSVRDYPRLQQRYSLNRQY